MARNHSDHAKGKHKVKRAPQSVVRDIVRKENTASKPPKKRKK